VLHLWISSILSFHSDHPVASYIFSLVLPSPLSFLQWRILEGSSYARCDLSRYPSFYLLYVGYFSPPWLFIILHSSHDRSNSSSPSFSSTTFRNFPRISDALSEVCKFQRPTKLRSKCTMQISTINPNLNYFSSVQHIRLCFFTTYCILTSIWSLKLPRRWHLVFWTSGLWHAVGCCSRNFLHVCPGDVRFEYRPTHIGHLDKRY
jgi:hypothetical protein